MRHFFYMPPEDFHGKIPFVLVDLINELRRRDVFQVQGIFRINGNDTDIKKLIAELDQGPVADWSRYEDIHSVSCAVKRYFRAMADREPILPAEILDCLMMATKIPDEKRQRELISTTIKMLTRPRILTLTFLMKFLSEVAANSSVNLMTPSNIAICFGPNLVSSDSLNFDDALSDQQSVNQATGLMIKFFDEIFADFPLTDNVFCNEDDLSELNQPPVNMTHVQNQILRCHLRKGRLIPFVPLCKILKSYARPTRKPPAPGPSPQVRTRSLFASMSLGSEECEAVLQVLASRSSGGRPSDIAQVRFSDEVPG
jgi:hypothetical protein